MRRGPLALLALLLLAAGTRAETQAAPAPVPVTRTADGVTPAPVVRVFEIRHADLQEVSVVLPSLLSESNVLTVDRASRTVTVVDEPQFVQRVADWLAQFDVPPHAVLVRIVLERGERVASAGNDAAPRGGEWKYVQLADTTLEVLERGEATQAIGADGAFEIHVRLGSVDAARGTMRFDEVSVSRREPQATPQATPVMRPVFSTSIEAKHQVGKVVMAQRDDSSDVALVLRLLALVREREK